MVFEANYEFMFVGRDENSFLETIIMIFFKTMVAKVVKFL